MVNTDRLEKKLPLLWTNGPSYSWEYQYNEILASKLKQYAPEKHLNHRNRVAEELDAWYKDALEEKKRHKVGKK
jgi:hypothetical protein